MLQKFLFFMYFVFRNLNKCNMWKITFSINSLFNHSGFRIKVFINEDLLCLKEFLMSILLIVSFPIMDLLTQYIHIGETYNF